MYRQPVGRVAEVCDNSVEGNGCFSDVYYERGRRRLGIINVFADDQETVCQHVNKIQSQTLLWLIAK